MADTAKAWYLRGPRRWQHFRAVPWKRLWLLLVAVFLLFSVFGFFYDLMTLGTMPYAAVATVAVYSGLNAALWIIVLSRLPVVFLGPLILLQFFNGPLMTWALEGMARVFALPAAPSSTGIRVAGTCIMIVVVVSYVFFVSYMRAEGRESFRLRTQLELAHGIQKTLVPPVTLRTEHFEVYGVSYPSDKVGGDLVDAILLPNGDLVAYVADIAGHGLSAGILMGMLKTAARTALLDAETGQPGGTLPELLDKLNRVLPEVKEPQMYATLTAFRLNADGCVWMAMAASPPVLHWSPRQKETRVVQEEQYPLGLLPVSGFRGEPVEVAPGDLLVVATDGILEVCDRREEEFGIDRLERAIASDAEMPLAKISESILNQTHAFGRQTDDQTLLLIRRVGAA